MPAGTDEPDHPTTNAESGFDEMLRESSLEQLIVDGRC